MSLKPDVSMSNLLEDLETTGKLEEDNSNKAPTPVVQLRATIPKLPVRAAPRQKVRAPLIPKREDS